MRNLSGAGRPILPFFAGGGGEINGSSNSYNWSLTSSWDELCLAMAIMIDIDPRAWLPPHSNYRNHF